MRTRTRLLLVGYPARYFRPFAEALEQAGFDVFWLVCLRSDEKHLLEGGVAPGRIVNALDGFDPSEAHPEQDAQLLRRLPEDPELCINNIILMDRILCRRPWPEAHHFLATVLTNLESRIRPLGIQLATSWRDHAMQLLTMRWLKSEGIPFVIPTRIRIPLEMYGFCTGVHTSTLRLPNPPREEDRAWARRFLGTFREAKVKPALKKSTRTFRDVMCLLPGHAQAFWVECQKARWDRGNRVTRYSLPDLVRMYVARRVRLLRYKLQSPAARVFVPGQGLRYFLYTLHTQPESSIDVQGAYHANQIELVRMIARSLPADVHLLVKVHPTDVDGQSLAYYRQIAAIPGVVLLDYSVDSLGLVEASELIFALTGTVAYEAALMGKPVIVFADNYFNRFPTVFLCRDIRGLPDLIQRALASAQVHADDLLEVVAQLKANVYSGEVSRTFGATNLPLRTDDLVTLQQAYQELAETLVR